MCLLTEAWKETVSDGDIVVAATVTKMTRDRVNYYAEFTRALGSGPKGRRFKSSRPDQFQRNSRNSIHQVTRFRSRNRLSEPECSPVQIGLAVRNVRDFTTGRERRRRSPARFETKYSPSRDSDAPG